ncbi:hypothetical protein [Streptomyces sp. NPDC007206]
MASQEIRTTGIPGAESSSQSERSMAMDRQVRAELDVWIHRLED